MRGLYTPKLWLPPEPRLLRDVPGAGYLVPPTKNPGDALTSALWNSYIRDNLDFGMVRPIADVIAGGAVASIDLTSIPGTFAHLLAVSYVRCDLAATNNNLLARFNNDSAANYDYQRVYGAAAAASAAETFAQGFAILGGIAGNTAGANLFSGLITFIPHYAAAVNNKVALSLAALKFGVASGNMQAELNVGFWRSNNAINRISFLPGGGNLVAGSRVTLYGMGGI